MSKISTPYSRAWEKFSMSNEFIDTLQHADTRDVGTKYLINRYRTAFDAGWNSKTSSILEAMQQMAEKEQTND